MRPSSPGVVRDVAFGTSEWAIAASSDREQLRRTRTVDAGQSFPHSQHLAGGCFLNKVAAAVRIAISGDFADNYHKQLLTNGGAWLANPSSGAARLSPTPRLPAPMQEPGEGHNMGKPLLYSAPEP